MPLSSVLHEISQIALTWLPILFFAILVAHTLSDYMSRPTMGMPTYPASGLNQ